MRKVALLLDQEIAYCREIFRGVMEYSHARAHWHCRDGRCERELVAYIRRWKPDGVIAQIQDEAFAKAVLSLKCPVVCTTQTVRGLEAVTVDVDHVRVGEMAAEFFLRRGYRHFGYFGSGVAWYSRLREQGFRGLIGQRGYEVHPWYADYRPRPSPQELWRRADGRLRRWLRGLPKPCAVFASNDLPARVLSEICRGEGLKIPYEIALMGVDNDEVESHLSHPPLTSIGIPARRLGMEAARCLGRMMEGKRSRSLVLPPTGIAERQSTGAMLVEDKGVRKALMYIHEYAARSPGVEEVVAASGVSRRVLELKFRAQLGSCILGEIQREQVSCARRLLAETRLPLEVVAEQAGMSSGRHLADVFKKHTGQTPSQYRREVA